MNKEREIHMFRHTKSRRAHRRRPVAVGTTAVAILTAIALACSTAGAATPSFGSASGTVAALTATTMEVQNPNTGQTTVTWTGTTTFSKVVTETVSAITAGECVTVTGTASKKSKTTIAARSISILPAPTSGSCTTAAGGRGTGGPGGAGGPGGRGGFQFGSGGRGGGGTTGTRPSGAGGRGLPGGLANLAIASGKVTAVSGSTLSACRACRPQQPLHREAGDEELLEVDDVQEADQAPDSQDAEAEDHDVEDHHPERDPGHDVGGPGRR